MIQTNIICNPGAALLANQFKDSKTLTRLDLSENSLGDAGAAALTVLLNPNCSLVKLILGNNKIGEEGVDALAKALPGASNLRMLGLAHNQLCHSGIRPLSKVAFGPLEELDLRGNIMDERAARVLAEGIVASEIIKFIDIRENLNSREATSILGRAIRDRGRHFRELQKKEKKAARKARQDWKPRDPPPPLEYYWIEKHQLRPLPGSGAVATMASKVCTVS